MPEEDDLLYNIALEVEQDAVFNAEMCECRSGLIADGMRGQEYLGAGCADEKQ